MKTGERLVTERLLIRSWTLSNTDRAFFHFICSNFPGRRFYPDRLSRKEADERLETIVGRADSRAMDWGVACLKQSGEQIGFTGLSPFEFNAPFSPGVEIGWQFDPAHWGKGYATEAARALIDYGFSQCWLNQIFAFAVADNLASIAVMQRAGMKAVEGGEFDHPQVPESHPQLKKHVLYDITKDRWLAGASR
ncbi:MAG: GNAT family N-acetyltransferase [Rhizobiaceae bacterium]